MNRRVVITGLGPITAFGVGIDPLWDAMVAGRTAIRRLERFAEAAMPCPFGAELADADFDVREFVPKSYRKATKLMCRDIALAVGAAAFAVSDAELVTGGTEPDAEPSYRPDRFGCLIGAGLISADVNELTAALVTSRIEDDSDHDGPAVDLSHWGRTGMTNLTPLWLLKYLPNMLACHVSIIHGCRGPSNTITCCEASSALSLGEATRVIQRGDAEACLSGGAEHKLNPFAFIRHYFTGRLAEAAAHEDLSRIICPFDEAARGTIVGEGGGILVLEESQSASDRGATCYAEVAGFAATQSSCLDAAGLRARPDDTALADAIEAALGDAALTPDDVDAIAPFGCSIPHVDQWEADAVKRVFGSRAAEIELITTVPNVGNLNAGNAAVSACVVAKALRDQRLPARLNTSESAGLCAAACSSRSARLNVALVLASGQGGQNGALVLKRVRSGTHT